jgi:hypothetical protein
MVAEYRNIYTNLIHMNDFRVTDFLIWHFKIKFQIVITVFKISNEINDTMALKFINENINSLFWTIYNVPKSWMNERLVFESQKGQEFSLLHIVQTGSQAHQTSYTMGTRGSFPGGKVVGIWSSPLTSN